jgi:DNA-binding IclR family transcriptional regulator
MRQQHKTRAVAVMIRELQYGATSREMVEASGLHVNTIWRWMRALRAEGLVYVEGWERTPGAAAWCLRTGGATARTRRSRRARAGCSVCATTGGARACGRFRTRCIWGVNEGRH